MAAQYTTVTVFVFTDMEDSQLVNGTWSTEPPFPLNGRNQCYDSREASSPASLTSLDGPDGFGRPACWRLACEWRPPYRTCERHPTTATATSWSENQLETHHPRPIVGLESPIGLFVQGGQVTSLLTIDFYLHSSISIKLFVLGGGHYSSLQSTPFIFHRFLQRNMPQALMI